jgi:amino acid adenylation domain-containing protein
VKLRGFRIELGEIEATLRQHPAVGDVVVTADGDSPTATKTALHAYIVPAAGQAAPAPTELRLFLGQRLPDYLIPAHFLTLAALPLTPNGKVDRAALPTPTASRPAITPTAPRTPMEAMLVNLWSELLGSVPVSPADNFFELGGHSLLAIQLIFRLRQALERDVPLRLLFEDPTVAGLAIRLERLGGQNGLADHWLPLPAVTANPAGRFLPFPLTDVQQAYWLGRGDTFDLGNVSTHNYFELESEGVELERLEWAWQQLITRHDMLRAIFLADGQQQVLAEVPLYRFATQDLRGRPAGEQQLRLMAVRQDMSHQVLAAHQWPLFDIRASRLDGNLTRLHLSFDALVADGWSLLIFAREWADLYNKPSAELPRLDLTFRDYLQAEQAILQTEAGRTSREYWLARLDTLPPAPELPVILQADTLERPYFKRRRGELVPEQWQQFKEQAGRFGLTPSAVLLAAFAEVLATWSKNPRFTITLTLFNRLPLHPQVNQIVGDFTSLNLLAVDHTQPEATFAGRAARLQQQLWSDLDHPYFGGVKLLRELARRQGVLQVEMPVVFTSLVGQDAAVLNEFGRFIYGVSQTPQVWLDHQAFEQAGSLVFHWDGVEALLPDGCWDDLFTAYSNLLQRLATSAEAWQVEQPPSLLPDAQAVQRAAVNKTAAPLPAGLLHSGFLEQAVNQPTAPAVFAPGRTLTYGQLLHLSSQLGNQLRQAGVVPNQLVAVVMEKGWEQVAAVLGVLLSGAAYLPIDPDLPQERRNHLLQHGRVTLALSQPHLMQRLSWPADVRPMAVDEGALMAAPAVPLPATIQQPTDLAYVIYTSGSTGLPKGVMMSHQATLNTIVDINERFNVTGRERVLAVSSLSFDLSVYDIFGTLTAGGAMVLPSAEAAKDPAHWADLMQQHGVTLWNSVPALLQLLTDYLADHPAARPSSLRLAMLSGDWIPLPLPDEIRAIWPRCQVVSLGGATEAAIWSIFYPIEQVSPRWKSIPYGKPLRNQSFHVLNHHLADCPTWVPGELYIGGVGLAEGYWQDAERTAERFITHPRTGQRLYRTGDLGRYLPDGHIEFLGREDFQVKVGGHRIELGEIEAALLAHPAVKEAVVAAVGERHTLKQLVAYVVPETGPTALSSSDFFLPVQDERVIRDPIERFEFELKQWGMRRIEPGRPVVRLPQPALDETVLQGYLRRQSHRQFLARPVSLVDFSHFLGSLQQLQLTYTPLPKYRYPSAGSLYPVQLYLHIKAGRVEGVAGGLYYYHPSEHQLVWIQDEVRLNHPLAHGANQAIIDHSAFCLFLVGHMEAITPLYGELSRDFCLLEAGYIGQLLMSEAPAHQIGLCPIGHIAFDELATYFELLASQQLLHTFAAGAIDPAASASSADQPIGDQLQRYLRQKLPDYMVPHHYLSLPRLPLTANGKVDRRALPLPAANGQHPGTAEASNPHRPPSLTEKTVAEIWAAILGRGHIGRHDNFFDLGTNSILATRLVLKIRDTFPVELPLRTFFEAPTIAQLASYIDRHLPDSQPAQRLPVPIAIAKPAATTTPLPPHLLALQKGESDHPPLFLVHPLAGFIFPYTALVEHVDRQRPIYGFQSIGAAGEATPLTSIPAMAAQYVAAMRQVQPEGPYHLAGWSLGATIALEMAGQLQQQQQTVAWLAAIDPPLYPAIQDVMALFRAGRYFLTLISPELLPYVYDYLYLRAGNSRTLAAARRWLLDWLHAPADTPAKAGAGSRLSQPELGRLLQIVQANIQAARHYRPSTYSGRLTLFQIAEEKESREQLRQWQRLAGEVVVETIPGNHMTLLRPPHVQVLGQQLENSLRRSQTAVHPPQKETTMPNTFGKLILTQPDGPEQVFELSAPITTIGSADANNIVIRQAQVSRAHARLEWNADGCTVYDLNSTKGTILNNQRIQQAKLVSGDVLLLGQASLRFEANANGAEAATGDATVFDAAIFATNEPVGPGSGPRPRSTRQDGDAIVEIQPGGARPPLFCVAARYQDEHLFTNLAAHLSPDQPVYALQPPQSPGQSWTKAEALAGYYLDAVRDIQASGPYQLAGFNIGGIIAYEMAQQLRAAGAEVATLALLDTPYLWANPVAYLYYRSGQSLNRAGSLLYQPAHRLVKATSLGRLALKSTQAVKETLHGRFPHLVHRLEEDMFAYLDALSDQAYEMNLRALTGYQAKPYAGRFTLLLANESPVQYYGALYFWRTLAGRGLDVHFVPGSYLTMFDRPHVETLAGRLAALLTTI